MSIVRTFVLACLVALGAPAQERPAPGDLFPGICFGPYRTGEAPGGLAPLPSAIRADLAAVAKLAPRVRVYGLGNTGVLVPEFCADLGLKCWAGAWIGTDRAVNDLECELARHVAIRHPEAVEAVLVGNEVLLRGDRDEGTLRRRIEWVRRELRAADVDTPVGTAEPWSVWIRHADFARAYCDVVVVHVHPYWDGVPAESAAKHTIDKLDEVRAAIADPKIRIVLGEFGWPTAGAVKDGARPGTAEAARYYADLLPLLRARKELWFPFEMWDEAWKASDEGSVGPHWGFFDAGGAPKPALLEAIPELAAGRSDRPPRAR